VDNSYGCRARASTGPHQAALEAYIYDAHPVGVRALGYDSDIPDLLRIAASTARFDILAPVD